MCHYVCSVCFRYLGSHLCIPWLFLLLSSSCILQVEMLEVQLKALDSTGSQVHSLTPGQNVSIVCTYDTPPNVVRLMNGTDKPVFVYDYSNQKTKFGEGFAGRVWLEQITNSNVSLRVFYPYCSRDGTLTCEVSTPPEGFSKKRIDLPFEAQPRTVSLEAKENRGKDCTYVCTVLGVAPKGDIEWEGGCQVEKSTIEEGPNCLFDHQSEANCQQASGSVKCHFKGSSPHLQYEEVITVQCGGLNAGEIAGIFVGVIAIIAIVIAIIVGIILWKRNNRNTIPQAKDNNEEPAEDSELNSDLAKPHGSDTTERVKVPNEAETEEGAPPLLTDEKTA